MSGLKKFMLIFGVLLAGFIIGAYTMRLLVQTSGPSGPITYREKVVVAGTNAIAEAAARAEKSVVNINTIIKPASPFGLFEEFFPPVPREGTGSGVIIRTDGYVLTNAHVVRGATNIQVTLLDGRKFTGRVVGADPISDLAVVKIDGENIPSAVLGDSDELRTGDWALAIGSPYGLTSTVTLGIISAVNRRLEAGEVRLDRAIQTDAAINRGNSGGPLVNIKGEVIGINTAIFSPTGGNIGIGFAIPINDAKLVLDDLIKRGQVARPWLGVRVQPVNQQLAAYLNLPNTKGLVVVEVLSNSSAEAAGLQVADVLLKVDGAEVNELSDLHRIVQRHKINDTVSLFIYREGRNWLVNVKLSERSY